MSTPADPAAVVTGMGIVAPTGVGVDQHWQSVLAGKSGIARISRFDPSRYPSQFAGEVPGFAPENLLPSRLIPQTDNWTHMALVATEAALADAAVDPAELNEYEMAVVTASSSGGTEFGQREMERLYRKGPSWVSAYQSIAWFYAATTGQVSIRHGMRGANSVLCAEQAGGLDVLAKARSVLRTGTRLVVSGGVDAAISPYGLVAQLASGRLSTESDPERAYLPFDVEASGHVAGEGGAILIVESVEPRNEGHRWGFVLGHASGFDPEPASARPRVLRSVIERALADAGLEPSDVDVVFADGAGVAAEDTAEAGALRQVFGPRGVPVTVPKSLTGRLYGGGAALDVATALLSLRHGVIPQTAGTTRVDDGYEIDLVWGEPRHTPLRTALVLARGHGGFSSALVLGAA